MDTSNHGIDWDAVITELQKPNGWCKGSFGDTDRADGGVCLLGSIYRVTGIYRGADKVEASERINHAIGALMPIVQEQFADRSPGGHVPSFNDHDDTTLDDVILVCEKARVTDGSSWA